MLLTYLILKCLCTRMFPTSSVLSGPDSFLGSGSRGLPCLPRRCRINSTLSTYPSNLSDLSICQSDSLCLSACSLLSNLQVLYKPTRTPKTCMRYFSTARSWLPPPSKSSTSRIGLNRRAALSESLDFGEVLGLRAFLAWGFRGLPFLGVWGPESLWGRAGAVYGLQETALVPRCSLSCRTKIFNMQHCEPNGAPSTRHINLKLPIPRLKRQIQQYITSQCQGDPKP